MRKLLLICAVLLGLGGIAIAHMVRLGVALDADGAAYVDSAFPAIAGEWDEKALDARASPRLQSMEAADKLPRLFQLFKQGLGSLVSYQGAKGSTTTAVLLGHGATTSGRYAIAARFEKGSAEIDFTIVKIQKGWRIDSFYVKSTNLVENLPGREI